MKVPILPLSIAAAILGVVIYWVSTAKGPERSHFGAPILTRVGEFDGTETEVSIAPDGKQYATIVSGNVWLLNIADGSRRQVTETDDRESFPSWTPDSHTLTFTRGSDTWTVNTQDPQAAPSVLKSNATSLEWSRSGRTAFVRDRELWLANSNGMNEIKIIDADPDPDITIHAPRFSPDSSQISFIKSLQNQKGEVWIVDVQSKEKRALISDRTAENPMDTAWIMEGKQLVYLTDRSGAYALWTIDFAENTLLTLTVTLNVKPLERIGIAAWKDRIVVPRHFVHSDIALSDGTAVRQSDELKFEPAVSPDGSQIAYTVQSDHNFSIWTCGIHGENPVLRVAGREPRWASNGYQLVYTNTDLEGNPDIWKLDLRNNDIERVTDAEEIDSQADWQPRGQTIAFASNRGGPMAIWSVAANVGRRVPLNSSGYYPRYSSDGQSILFWSAKAFWKMDASGNNLVSLRSGVPEPLPAVLIKNQPKIGSDADVNGGKAIWPVFDVLPDGRYVVAPVDIRETALWAVDLTFADK